MTECFFFSDTAVNINPTAEQIANIAIHTSKVAKYFKMKPKNRHAQLHQFYLKR